MEQTIISAGGLHALAYCERLFYLENVELARVADERVFAGRRAHEEHIPKEKGTWSQLRYESHALGLRGEVDVLRRLDGALVPYEIKRGHSAGRKGAREAWDTDRLQVAAYALLVEEQFGQTVVEGRVRYLADHITVRVTVDDMMRRQVLDAIEQARRISVSIHRPPVTKDANRCIKCSLAPVCLPEEARLTADPKWRAIRLLPMHARGVPLHVLDSGSRVGRSGETLKVTHREGEAQTFPISELASVVLHGHAQMTTQAIRLCADREVSVHWVTAAGGLIGSLSMGVAGAQRQLRQFEGLYSEARRLSLTKRLVHCKVASQLRFLLRASRGQRPAAVASAIRDVRTMLRRVNGATVIDELRGLEGAAASAYFGALPELVAAQVSEELKPSNRTRQPARDRFSALLNYAYGMLYRQVLSAIIAVGLHPGIGFYHRPRSSAQTLALDVMEIFRVPLADMPVLAAINRRTFDPTDDFVAWNNGITLSDDGKRKLITAIERRMHETWRHDVVGYSLSYARLVELEIRLLEKEWCGEPGLFARLRIR